MPNGGLTKVQTEARRQRIVELTQLGWSAAEIAHECKTTARTVERTRVKMGVAQPPPRRLTADEVARIEAMLADGASITDVARSVGRSIDYLQRRFRGRGWTRSQAGQFAALRWQMRSRLGIDI